MFQELASHNKDIDQLGIKGYATALDSGHLVVRDIPYLDDKGALCWGAIVCKLKTTDNVRYVMEDHQIYFAGSHPHGLDGKPIQNLAGGAYALPLISTDIVVQRSMSNKPPSGFADHVEKIDSYVTILCGPAMERYPGATPLTFRKVKSEGEESVFKFADTLTSRAEIGDLAQLFKNEVVAIIGLGGTGAYVLDYMVKTPVAKIVGFDADPYHVHNAFRSPGRLDADELDHSKAEVYQGRYENFREGLTLTPKFVDASCEVDLKGVTFAFVCVDKGSARRGIFDLLIRLRIPFIDVGMGLDRKQHKINGTLRATYYEPANAQEMVDMGLAELADRPDDEYRVTVQIAELNALNACLAVLRYKQVVGFYLDENDYGHILYKVNDIKIFGEVRVK